MKEFKVPMKIEVNETCFIKMQEIKLDYETDTRSKISMSEIIQASVEYYYNKLYKE